jgi:hypothetical protein
VNHHEHHHKGTTLVSLEENESHERKTMDRSSSSTQSYDFSHHRIEHKAKNV